MSAALLEAAMATVADAMERELAQLLALPEAPERLAAAMRHACLGAGKRLRPFLVATTGTLFDADAVALRRVGAAVELIHSYSLVHDDLPAMDDAALRRGRPTCHVAFGEATAILAGDALQALAFEVLGRRDWAASPAQRQALIASLGRASGVLGMCGGQMLDLEAETRTLDLDDITLLQMRKTGALITFSVEAGCILGGASPAEQKALLGYAQDLGLAFQIKDDLLDLEGDAEILGKDAGADAARGKATFVSALGVDGARRRLGELRRAAGARLDFLGERATLLAELFNFVINRRS